jgi:hypothetical protein
MYGLKPVPFKLTHYPRYGVYEFGTLSLESGGSADLDLEGCRLNFAGTSKPGRGRVESKCCGLCIGFYTGVDGRLTER